MAKGARGKPCRCGSGRPSEECCGGDGGSPTPTNRATRDSTLAKLLAFAFQPAFDSDHTIAETIFWGDVLTSARPDELAWLLDSQDANIKYNAWFLFDWDADGNGTVADLFLEDEEAQLTPAERRFLQRLTKAHLRLYEVEGVERGRGVHVRDLWNDQRLFVIERTASEEIITWDILGARVAPDGHGTFVFEGGVYLYPAQAKSDVVSRFRRLHRQYHRKHPTDDSAAFFRRYGMVFHHLWLDLVIFPPPPTVVTTEGDPVVFCRAIFDIQNPAEVRASLAARPDVSVHEEGRFHWIERSDDGDLLLGVWEVGEERLELETTSQERATRGRGWIESFAGSLVRYRATGMETLAHAMDELRHTGPSLPTEPPDDLDVVQELYHRHYSTWLDVPVPALNNRTPRDAARTRLGRTRVTELLKELENRSERTGKQGRAAYDFRWMWRELGIERPELS